VRSRGDDPELEEFGEAVRPLAERATELAVVAEMRSYKGRDEDVLDRAAVAADFFAVHLPDAEALSSATEAMELYGECEPARGLIETVADEFE
jgi:hypothetical protein